MQARRLDDVRAEFTGFGAAYLRALESSRTDRIVNDPFAGLLTQQEGEQEFFLQTTLKAGSSWGNLIAIRSRYLDEALEHRDTNIRQVVILGAGLDTRAYRLDSLRGCHILAIDQSCQAFNRLSEVMKREDAAPTADKVDCIVANLAEDDWDSKLLARGFDPRSPTFWVMEGLLPYLERSSILTLLDTIDGVSAPGSELWADMAGQATFNFAGTTPVTMKYSEDDPLHGVLSKIPWCLTMQASLENEGTHFGRKWTPLTCIDTDKNVPIAFIMGKKPVPTQARLKDVCPGLDW
ncbi:hypothetical protein PHYPSEUDO_010050 [Phytophthora pseudosyringae]|uniref:S-adenosyl-L-methionine-dependent methyltransferase n=1 Tax=Phytophthora pseudosyringae TaxID=221518 RepID=A0A8T1WC74_9STRA|nr:hypothetical protein PHYPSEUDO_010050 [Phytophthora pseudosyringae]